MEQYYRMVIDLYKKALQNSVSLQEISSAQTVLAQEVTKTHILDQPNSSELEQLEKDLIDLKIILDE